MRDFHAVAEGAGAVRIIAAATSAVRESSNADELVDAIARATGIDVEIIDGEDEARYSFLGAVHGLAIEHGTLVDIGGGSLELTTFRSRRMTGSYTLPLGALRLSERFFRDDPPSQRLRCLKKRRVVPNRQRVARFDRVRDGSNRRAGTLTVSRFAMARCL